MPKRLLAVSCAALCGALGATAGPAAAAPKRIAGKLSKPGYTVLALASDGRARSVHVRGHRFTVRPPAERVTLHLRASDGVYSGPIVMRRKDAGRRAVLGVRAGARLGEIRVGRRYAKVVRRPRARWIDAERVARARRGVPIGAGVFGRVRSRNVRDPAPGDRDLDGIPDRLDIDDDGDRVLDKLDRRVARARAAATDPFSLASGMGVPLQATANVNAGSTPAAIEAVLPRLGWLLLDLPEADSVELDCGGAVNPSPPPPLLGGLSYCSYGGTGAVVTPARSEEFPECCDGDGDGFGAIRELTELGPDFGQFQLHHGATSTQIRTGDLLIERVIDDGQERQLVDMHQFIFATAPAVASYVDESGARTVIEYPVEFGEPGTRSGEGEGLPVTDGPDAGSDVEVDFTLWRPQRRPTSEAECASPAPGCTETEWIDIGGLKYTAGVGMPDWCPQSTFEIDDAQLSPGFGDAQGGGFQDLARDRRASAANTMSFRLNLTDCLDSYGLSFRKGETRRFDFHAFTPFTGEGETGGAAGADNATTSMTFSRR